MPSFSLMMLPSLESITASVSPSAFFFRNFFRPAHSHPQSAVAVAPACRRGASHAHAQDHSHRTLAELAVHERCRRRQRIRGIVKLVERLELDHLRQAARAQQPGLLHPTCATTEAGREPSLPRPGTQSPCRGPAERTQPQLAACARCEGRLGRADAPRRTSVSFSFPSFSTLKRAKPAAVSKSSNIAQTAASEEYAAQQPLLTQAKATQIVRHPSITLRQVETRSSLPAPNCKNLAAAGCSRCSSFLVCEQVG